MDLTELKIDKILTTTVTHADTGEFIAQFTEVDGELLDITTMTEIYEQYM